MPDHLQVWLHGVHVADVEQRSKSDVRLRLRHTDAALELWPLNTPLISCSLPLTDRPVEATAFLRGMLPEGDALAALAARASTSVVDTFGLFARYGRDLAGALVIGHGPPDESRFGLESYDHDELADEVAALDENPLGIHDDTELSLAGLQSKLLLVKTPEGWARPLHGRPSTHILKAEDRRYPGLAQAEADCLALARAVGLTPVHAEVQTFGGIPCLITERYDRTVAADGAVSRVHQEDLCQAMGIDGAGNRGRAKYQRGGGGGPGWRQAAGLLDAYSEDAVAQLSRLVAAVAFTIAIGNADAHAKNLSFLHDTPTTVKLAPLYDTIPTLRWPKLTVDSAMSVNNLFSLQRLSLADILAESSSWPLDRRTAEQASIETLEKLRGAVQDLECEELALLIVARCEALLSGRSAGD